MYSITLYKHMILYHTYLYWQYELYISYHFHIFIMENSFSAKTTNKNFITVLDQHVLPTH